MLTWKILRRFNAFVDGATSDFQSRKNFIDIRPTMVTDVRSETAVTKAYRLSVNPDVDILLRRADLPRAIEAMQAGGFFYHQTFGVDMFLDGPDTKPSEAVQVIFAHEKVKESDLHLTPDVDDSEQGTFPCSH